MRIKHYVCLCLFDIQESHRSLFRNHDLKMAILTHKGNQDMIVYRGKRRRRLNG
jgi:hypothetical protein